MCNQDIVSPLPNEWEACQEEPKYTVAYWSELRQTWIITEPHSRFADQSSFEECLKALDYITSEEIYICEV